MALHVVRKVLKDRTRGMADDFHNLASALAQRDYESLAADVVALGASFFPHNVDLLAGSVQYYTSSGDLKKAGESYAKLCHIDRSLWNWRAFVFSGDYLETADRIDHMLMIYKSFREQIPDDERGYSQEGIYYFRLGRLGQAAGIFEQGLEKCRRCAQSANMLAQVYTKQGRFEDAIAAASRAIESNAEEQPSTNQSSTFWHRALAQDARLHKIVEERARGNKPVITGEILTLAKNAILDYNTALSLPDALPSFRGRGPERKLAITVLLRRNGASDEEIKQVMHQDSAEEEPSDELRAALEMLDRMDATIHSAVEERAGGDKPDDEPVITDDILKLAGQCLRGYNNVLRSKGVDPSIKEKLGTRISALEALLRENGIPEEAIEKLKRQDDE